MRDVTGAKVGRFDVHIHPPARAEIGTFVSEVYGFERLFQNRRNFPRDAVYALAVGAVGGNGNIENIIVQSDHFFHVGADGRAFAENEDAVHVGAVVPIVVDAELFARAEHAARFYAAQFPLLYFYAAVQGRAVQRDGHERALEHVVRARNDLNVLAVFAAVQPANFQLVRIGMLFKACDPARDAAVYLFPDVFEFFHFESAGKEPFLQFFGCNIYINIIFEPTERYFHFRVLHLILELL